LTLAADSPVVQVAERTAPDPKERPAEDGTGGVLSVDLQNHRGFTLTMRSGRRGHYEADGDEGLWEWEPANYVTAGFRIDKEQIEKGTENMLGVVARLLDSGSEDAALFLNSDTLLLTRLDGVVRKHGRPSWWSNYPFANEIVPD
jgi:hypothetical protein